MTPKELSDLGTAILRALVARDEPVGAFAPAGVSAGDDGRVTIAPASPDDRAAWPYTAPERLAHPDGAGGDERADLFSAAAVLYERVHGRPPFRARETREAIVAAMRDGRRARPALPDGFPAALSTWFDRCLAASPADRPADGLGAWAEAWGVTPPADVAATPGGDDASPLRETRVHRRLRALYEMIRVVNSESEPDGLLEKILDLALEVVGAERGMILLREEDDPESFAVRTVRNLDRETVEDGARFSRHVVAAAGEGRSVVTLDAQADERFAELRSVSLNSIQSLMCVPLRVRGDIVGAVYLDSRAGAPPFDLGSLRFLEAFADHAAVSLDNARRVAALQGRNLDLRAAAEARATFGNMVGRSEPMQRVFETVRRVCDSELPVLIQGESGTGKELVAQAIHFNGPRRERTFVGENCAAIPDSLLQSELFGHVRGAFTGAEHDRRGLFEQADGGSLFLDEVGDMSAAMQAQLLRALQEGEVRRVGSDTPIRVDVRVIAATHRDLGDEVRAGRFREDLMYRLQVLLVRLPPLRERSGDVPLLVAHFLDRIARARGRAMPNVSEGAMRRLERCRWPGNVRQLENVLQRLALLAGDGTIDASLIDADPRLASLLPGDGAPAPRPASDVETPTRLADSERERIAEALRRADGNRTRAARLLGISRATIYRRLREFDL